MGAGWSAIYVLNPGLIQERRESVLNHRMAGTTTIICVQVCETLDMWR